MVLHDAVPADTRGAATQTILDHLGARLDDPESWYELVPGFHRHAAGRASHSTSAMYPARQEGADV